MRRARIKALAAVPVRKKPSTDPVDSTDANDTVNEEQKKENVSSVKETEQEATKDIHIIRRARIKGLAAVPVRKKSPTNSVDPTDANDTADKEKKGENVSGTEEKEGDVARIDTSKQEEREEKDASSVDILEQGKQKEKDVPSTDIPEREAGEGIAKVQEKTKEQVIVKELVVVDESDSEKLCSPLKSNSQELLARAEPNSQEPQFAGFKPDRITDQSVQKSIPLPDVPTVIDTGKDISKRKIRNL